MQIKNYANLMPSHNLGSSKRNKWRLSKLILFELSHMSLRKVRPGTLYFVTMNQAASHWSSVSRHPISFRDGRAMGPCPPPLGLLHCPQPTSDGSWKSPPSSLLSKPYCIQYSGLFVCLHHRRRCHIRGRVYYQSGLAFVAAVVIHQSLCQQHQIWYSWKYCPSTPGRPPDTVTKCGGDSPPDSSVRHQTSNVCVH